MGSGFNVTAELFLADNAAAETTVPGPNATSAAASNKTDGNWNSLDGEASSVTLFGNGSGMALVTYVPREAGTSFLYGEEKNSFVT